MHWLPVKCFSKFSVNVSRPIIRLILCRRSAAPQSFSQRYHVSFLSLHALAGDVTYRSTLAGCAVRYESLRSNGEATFVEIGRWTLRRAIELMLDQLGTRVDMIHPNRA